MSCFPWRRGQGYSCARQSEQEVPLGRNGEYRTSIEDKDLVSGDVALSADGRELVITDITIDEWEETVYNFEVEEYHTYFVGEVGVWVHNYTLQIGLGASLANFLGISGEDGIAISYTPEEGFDFGFYAVTPTLNRDFVPSGHSDSGISVNLNFTFSTNRRLSDLNGDSVSTGLNVDIGGYVPSIQLGGSINFPTDPNAKPTYSFAPGLSMSLRSIYRT
ncbi:polymorphic toxin-type HINT domain-containing protein [Leptospira sp. 96542]|nr:polymorphic toxin-type HINT domain-containing protein [Leptospira sp. 96542]